MNTDTPSNIDIEALAREIAMRMDPDALLDAADVGAMLKCSARYVAEDYAKAPGFPKAVRLTGSGGRRSQPRWRRCDIKDWVQRQAEPRAAKGGRPRKQASDF